MPAVEPIWPPHPYRAGFCITDDTDAATLESVAIVYDFLSAIGLKTSKTVWAFAPQEPCGVPALPDSILRGVTLEDARYLDYCVTLAERGFEICLHGASAGNNLRERTAQALALIERRFGRAGTYVCHAKNAENPYWHEKVAPAGPARALLALASRYRCSGEDRDSPYFWGDLCLEQVKQIRLFRTRDIDTLAANPSMPYFDPEKPLVPGWFAATKRSFADCTSADALDGLERVNGLCVLYQYMHRYADLSQHRVDDAFRAGAERLMGRPWIWVDTTSAIMDRLRLMQGLFVACLGEEAWLVNANDRAIEDVQLRVDSGAAARSIDDDVTQAQDTVRIRRIAAGEMRRISFDEPTRAHGPSAIALDPMGRGRIDFGFGEIFVNVGAEPWRASAETLVPVQAHRAVFADAFALLPMRPMRRASRAEIYRLLVGQLAIIGREIAFKGRPVDSRKFLGAGEIALEDHGNW